MAIDVVWQDESGGVLGRSPVPWEDRMSRRAVLETSHCLQYVDPVGDATFNQLQLPQLIREMERAIGQIHPSDLRRRAEQVLAFVRNCEDIHTYVKFIGD
jgi:hypothetical protein